MSEQAKTTREVLNNARPKNAGKEQTTIIGDLDPKIKYWMNRILKATRPYDGDCEDLISLAKYIIEQDKSETLNRVREAVAEIKKLENKYALQCNDHSEKATEKYRTHSGAAFGAIAECHNIIEYHVPEAFEEDK
jgi:hypothetical protein